MNVNKMEELREVLNKIAADESVDYEVVLAVSRQMDECICCYLNGDKVEKEKT